MLLEHRSLRAITSVGDIFSNTCILSSMRWQLSLATVVVQSKAVDRCMRLLIDLVAFLRHPSCARNYSRNCTQRHIPTVTQHHSVWSFMQIISEPPNPIWRWGWESATYSRCAKEPLTFAADPSTMVTSPRKSNPSWRRWSWYGHTWRIWKAK